MDPNRVRLAATEVALGAVALFLVFVLVSMLITPPATASAADRTGGPTLVTAFSETDEGTITLYDAQGQQVWQRQRAISYGGAQRLRDGRLLVAFQGRCGTGCIETGARILSPDARRIRWEYTFTVRTAHNSEVHDVEYLPARDEILVVDMDRERVFTVNRSTKEITWQWNASSYYEAPPDPTRTDWLHMNDVDRIGDGRYLVSVRNANQLVIVERGTGVVEVINANRNPDVLNRQHNPQWLGEGRVLVADSENDRIVELQRQPSGTWRVAWTDYTANGIRYDWPRDADRLPNGHTLIQDTRNSRVVEINESGAVVWARQIPEQSYDADRNGREYPAGPPYPASASEPVIEQPFPVVAVLWGALRHVVPLPAFLNEWHMLAALGTLCTLLAAGVVHVGARIRLWRQAAA